MVYLIHFKKPFHHARHYIGYTEDLEQRMCSHGTPKGSKLMHAVDQAGIPYKVARTWEGGRDLERRLKKQKNSSRFCPICNPDSHKNHFQNGED